MQQIKLNKDIMEYKEEIYFGLTLRQLVCTGLALVAAAGIYFATRNVLPSDVGGTFCIMAALPLALLGFFRYNGMTAEQFLLAWTRQTLMPRGLPYRSEDYLYIALKHNREEQAYEAAEADTAEITETQA